MRGTFVARTWRYNPVLNAPLRYRKACAYEAFVPDTIAESEFRLSSAVVAGLSEAEHAIAVLNAKASPALVPMSRLLLRTESIASSKVEGLQVGIRQIARAESRFETGQRPTATVSEVLGNINAMEFALERALADDHITPSNIAELHKTLMDSAPNSHIAGVIRNEQNWIGGNNYNPCGADFVPPPPEEVGRLLDDLCAAAVGDFISPLIQAALVHAQFETIHPFEDGNGRTGRALIHLVLRRRGVATNYVPPVSVVLANQRDAYINGLEAFREGRVEEWLELFAVSMTRAAGLAQAYLSEVDSLTDSWKTMLEGAANPRSDAAAWSVINHLPGCPVITSPVASAVTGRSKVAVLGAIEQLVDCGVLVPLSASKRNRSWEAVGLLDLLEGLEAGRLPAA